MFLQMIGIDYEKADLTIREHFTFHKHSAMEAMKFIQEENHIKGVLLITTCNRTELYISTTKKIDFLKNLMCSVKKLPVREYEDYLTERVGFDAMEHLFQLSCGLKSKVFGEDQIITQVKESLYLAREAKTTDMYIEKIFQTAIATAKKVKTEVHLTAVKTSVIEEMMNKLREDLYTLQDKKCLVIGNGEIGRLAAQRMVEEQADVTITIRNYKTKDVEIPSGCATVSYKERYSKLGIYDVIISATTSPHYTIEYEESYAFLTDNHQHILVDLAVPRDISPKFKIMKNIVLYNIDTLGGLSKTEQDNEAIAVAQNIIKRELKELESWDGFREYVPVVKSIGHIEAVVNYNRMGKKIKQMKELTEQSVQDELQQIIQSATERTITSMLFELRKNLPMEYWRVCMEAFQKDVNSKNIWSGEDEKREKNSTSWEQG